MIPVSRETGELPASGIPATSVSPQAEARKLSRAQLLLLTVFALVAFAVFCALGTWQLIRLQWKLDLIQRVNSRVHAVAVEVPDASKWLDVTAASDEYRHVRATGSFLYQLTTPVFASTEWGTGYWQLTPLRLQNGSIVLINRGFVSDKAGDPQKNASANSAVSMENTENIVAAQSGNVTVTGLLRLTERGGGFLRYNDPDNNRWFSRDVAAIAKARGLQNVAPFFVDADAEVISTQRDVVDTSVRPIGGLTVITFHNNHLVYAITWYILALMIAGGYWWAIREERYAT